MFGKVLSRIRGLGLRRGGGAPPDLGWVEPKTLSHHGVQWTDAWAGLQDLSDDRVAAHLEQEHAYATHRLAHTAEFQREIQEEMASRHRYASLSTGSVLRGHYYYRRVSGDAQQVLDCRRQVFPDGTQGREEVILDHAALARQVGGFASVTKLKISVDGALAVYTVDLDGDERYQAHVVDLAQSARGNGQSGGASAQRTLEVLEDVWTVEWAGDSHGLLYTRLDETHRPATALWHTPMTPQARDRVYVEEEDDEYFLDVNRTKDDQFITINSNSKENSEVKLLPAACDDPTSAPVVVHPRGDGVSYFVEHAGNTMYILTNADGAADYKVVSAPDADPAKQHWADFYTAPPGTKIEDAEVFADWLVVLQRNGCGLQEVAAVPYADPEGAFKLVLPGHPGGPAAANKAGGGGAGADAGADAARAAAGPEDPTPQVIVPHSNTDFWSDQFVFSTTSPLVPHVDWSCDLASQSVRRREEAKVAGMPHFDGADYTCYQQLYASDDGVDVPVTVVHQRGIPHDGTRPALVTVYAAYGENLEPEFRADHVVLLQRGWVVALCHARGGGERGSAWHTGGSRAHKGNSMKDLETCINGLVSAGLTAAGRVAVRGVSAGGLTAAALANERPELFGAVLLEVPFVDVRTAMLDPSLPLTVHERPEWGDPISSRDAFATISSYCPYTNIRDQAYPPVLLTTSTIDERVQCWQPAKFAARLRERAGGRREGAAEGDSGKAADVLLLTDPGGHFGSSLAPQTLAFLFDSLGELP